MEILGLLQTIGGNVWIYGGTFLLVLGILVFVHEWGHYIVAKLCGVHVESFSIGFGKEIWGINDKSGTRWKVSLIPLGGYVKMFGDSDPASAGHSDQVTVHDSEEVRSMTPDEREKAFFSKAVWKRALIVFAGPAINYIFAFILLVGLYTLNGQPITPSLGAAVIEDSAAYEAGFQPHDEILSIGGKKVTTFDDIRREMMVALDEEREFTIIRDGQEMTIMASPRRKVMEDRFGFKHSIGLLGLISPRHAISIENIQEINGRSYGSLEEKQNVLNRLIDKEFTIGMQKGEDGVETLHVRPLRKFNEELAARNYDADNAKLLYLADREASAFLKLDPVGATGEAFKQTWVITRGTFEALSQIIMGTRSAKELGGIIRIGAMAGDMAQQGIVAIILFTALLSINLGLINLFPIPMLDGGHLVFYAVESVLGKPVPEKIQEYAFQTGFVLLVAIMVFANLNDIVQLIL